LWGNNFVASVQNSQDGSSMPFSALRTDARDFFATKIAKIALRGL